MLKSHDKDLSRALSRPFPIGVEYYRPPTPPPAFWDEDLRRIRAAGMSIVRTFYCWNWAETLPGRYEFDDLDRLFDLADKHGLKLWVDTPMGTHTACPAWMLREHPDMAVVRRDGRVQTDLAFEAGAQGGMTHNFDHPMWRVYAERYLRQIVPRYKDHPAMGVWGTWDGISFAAAWTTNENYPPYNDYTITKYKHWLQARFSLEQLNERLLRRYRSWEDVDAPRSNDALVEMMLYRRFHYENMADHLGWMADMIDRLDGKHEQRSHGASFPRQPDEIISPVIDSWGLSHHSADRLTSGEPYSVANECFGFQWCRAVGRNHRWWNEEIYGSFVGGLNPRNNRTLPQESALFLWLTLIEGGAGAMFWQYRPEYMTFEAPGLNLMALDGEPTPRWSAIEQAIVQIDVVAPHLPVAIPRADMAIVYSAPSHEVFEYGCREAIFLQQLRALYRALWPHSVAMDVVTPAMDWSGYKLVVLPNLAVIDEPAVTQLRKTLKNPTGPTLIADGYFGTFAGKGHWSFRPPEGLDDLIDGRIADFNRVSDADAQADRNVLKTTYGEFKLPVATAYAILEPRGGTQPIATIGDDAVGLQSADGRFTWFGVSLAATACTCVPGQPTSPPPAGMVHDDIALGLARDAGVQPWFEIKGDRVVAFRRGGRDGSLVFLLNVENRTAHTKVKPAWKIGSARDLLNQTDLPVDGGAFEVQMAFGEVRVIHCTDMP